LRQRQRIPLAAPVVLRTLAAADSSLAAGALRGVLPAGLCLLFVPVKERLPESIKKVPTAAPRPNRNVA